MRPASLFLALFLTIWASQSKALRPLNPPQHSNPDDNLPSAPGYYNGRNHAGELSLIYKNWTIPYKYAHGLRDDSSYDGLFWFDDSGDSSELEPEAEAEPPAFVSVLCSSSPVFKFINVFAIGLEGGLIFNFPSTPSQDLLKILETMSLSEISDVLLGIKFAFTFTSTRLKHIPGTYDPVRNTWEWVVDNHKSSKGITIKQAYEELKEKAGNILMTGVIAQADEDHPGLVRHQRLFDAFGYGLNKKFDTEATPLLYKYSKRDGLSHYFAVEYTDSGIEAWLDDFRFGYPSECSTRKQPQLTLDIDPKIEATFEETKDYKPPSKS